jgi:hypothetical protein
VFHTHFIFHVQHFQLHGSTQDSSYIHNKSFQDGFHVYVIAQSIVGTDAHVQSIQVLPAHFIFQELHLQLHGVDDSSSYIHA